MPEMHYFRIKINRPTNRPKFKTSSFRPTFRPTRWSISRALSLLPHNLEIVLQSVHSDRLIVGLLYLRGLFVHHHHDQSSGSHRSATELERGVCNDSDLDARNELWSNLAPFWPLMLTALIIFAHVKVTRLDYAIKIFRFHFLERIIMMTSPDRSSANDVRREYELLGATVRTIM